MSEEDARRLLSSFGLTAAEVDVYLFVAKHSGLKCSQIAKGMRKNRARVYRTLKNLELMGMVERTVSSPVNFVTVPLEKIIDLQIKLKEEEESLLEQARKTVVKDFTGIESKIDIDFEKFSIIEGRKNIYPRIFQMIENSKKEVFILIGDECLFTAIQIQLYERLLKKVLKSKVKLWILRHP